MFSVALINDDNQALKMGKVLKEMGVNPSLPDTLNQTPLYYAAREGKNYFIDFLIENGCNVNHIDTYGQTPVFYACREGKIETIRKLVDLGADHDLVDNNG
jgi:ankyrin repeat protein